MLDREIDWSTGLFTIHTLDNKKIRMAAALINDVTGTENADLWDKLQKQSIKHTHQQQFLSSLNDAIKYAQISLDYYEIFLTRVREIARRIGSITQSMSLGQSNENPRDLEGERKHTKDLVFYFSQNYIGGMKRIYERLNHFNNTRSEFPEPIANTIKAVWKKKKSILEKYIEARNFNEHQSEHFRKEKEPFAEINTIVMGVYHASNNPQHQVELSRNDLESILAGQNEIFQSIIDYANSCQQELDKIFDKEFR